MDRNYNLTKTNDYGIRNRSNVSTGDRPKKEAILDLAKYKDQKVRVKFAGGREIVGILKGYDLLMNLVLDEVIENLRDEDGNITDQKRQLGLVVIRGTTLILFSPIDGSEEIKNPFLEQIKI
ncbi:unnamed protein product [Pneumocystis jirovecii]|uniref:Sm domain-containing protein n=2 Tax=Pneumocystis jirovecii TaxID=42068 RepID=L0PD19_PNEJI|nr:Sm-like protein LSM7 [Pneumocystis jirovecii RU7]KTW31728.1 hypothetical protein T551_00989 [Pneumocystis jirovecii RU7]CCJ30291.1 unnamed protein product [Pneumocystis jirovecii]